MADKPVYSNHLVPAGWEKVKGPITKAAIKTDVKGALDALYKQFWNTAPWDHLAEAVEFDDQHHTRFKSLLEDCATAAGVVSTRARAAMAEIDRKPLSRQLLKTSRDYLFAMEDAADDLQDTIGRINAEIEAARDKAQRSAAKAAASFAGWVNAQLKRAKELSTDCEQWTTAGFKSIAMVAPGTGSDAKSQAKRVEAQKIHDGMDKKITGFFSALHDLDHEVDTKAQTVPATDRLGHAAVASFKAALPALLQSVQACHQKLQDHPIPKAMGIQGAASRS